MAVSIETIAAILLAEFALSEDLGSADLPSAVGGVAGFIVLSYLLAVMASQRTRSLVRAARLTPYRIAARHRLHLLLHKVAMLLMYWALLFHFGWARAVQDALRLRGMSILEDLAVIAPFLAAEVVSWLALHATDMLLGRRIWSSWEYVWFKLRYTVLILLIPWCLLKFFEDAAGLLARLVSSDVAGYAAMGAVIVAAVVCFPVFLKWLFGAKSMPPAELRWRLEQICTRVGLKVRDILVWPMGGSRVLNAAVMGIVPRFRYILFSDALLDVLTYEECEAVLCHEIGHIKNSHTPLYLLFTAGFVLFVMSGMGLFSAELQQSHFFAAPILIALTCIYWRFVFGFVSRKFERQADLYAAEMMGSPVPIALALEKISLMSGDARELPQWRHYSIAERVRHLLDTGFEARKLEAYHARVRKGVRLGVVCVAGLVAWTAYAALTEPRGAAADVERLTAMAEENPEKEMIWLNLGRAWAIAGKPSEAAEAYCRVVTLSPGSDVALDAERELLALPVDKWNLHLALGKAFEEADWLDRAEAAMRVALGHAPGKTEVYIALARVLLEKGGMNGDALKLARLAVERAKGPGSLEVLADALFATGEKAEAVAVLEEALAQVEGARDTVESLREKLRVYRELLP